MEDFNKIMESEYHIEMERLNKILLSDSADHRIHEKMAVATIYHAKNYADITQRKGFLEESLAYIDQSLTLNKYNIPLYIILAEVKADLSDFEGAIYTLNFALGLLHPWHIQDDSEYERIIKRTITDLSVKMGKTIT